MLVISPACTEMGRRSGVCALVTPRALQPQHTLDPLLELALLLCLSLNRNLEPFGPFVIFYEHTNSLEILPHSLAPGSRSDHLVDCRTLPLVPCWAADVCLVTLFSRLVLKKKYSVKNF